MAKIDDLSSSLKLPTAEYELLLDESSISVGQQAGGLSMYSSSFKRGYGNAIFGADVNGIWLGAADFADAPFKVNMDGDVYLTSADGKLVLDTVNNRLVIYDADGIPRVLLGYQLNGF